jgi:hypothetical protein
MSNPVDAALMSKEAFLGRFLRGAAGAVKGIDPARAGAEFVGGAMSGGGMAAGAAGVGLLGAGAAKLMGAIQKKKDFSEMMDINPDLRDKQEQDPKFFNAAYTSLRSMNPTFGSDPIVAGGMMRRMTDAPESAGGILASSIKQPSAPARNVNFAQSLGPLSYRRDL